jgi:DNA-directed RNA polymerase specialized sigma subunit
MGSQLAKKLVTETVTVNPETPWLDVHGRELPDEVLKIESKSWSEKTWAEYLKTIETPISETLTSASCFQAALDSSKGTNEFLATAASRATQGKVLSALQKLTQKQRSIVQMTFWSGMSEREIAASLGISRSSVKTTKKRTLRKMQGLEVFKSTVLEFRTSAEIQE